MATQAGRAGAARRGTSTPGGAARGAATPAVAEAVALAPVEDQLGPGAEVGEYELTEKIGEGGMGVVWGGVHPVIGKKVAIKLLNPGLSQDPTIVQRFVQEARAVNQIGHRNIVDIFAFGQLRSGRHYFVMEHLKGVSLKTRLEQEPRLGHRHALTVLAEVADALAAAHAQGIVHRDLKPDNIYLCDGGGAHGAPEVKLLDFGIAKLLRRGEDLGQTRTGAPIGTPFYMAPEQCRGRNVDARTDLYAMGVIMFEMFTGRLPFAGADYIDTVNAHLSSTPPLPTDFADIPVELESLILQCLEKDPDRRPQQAAELCATLRALAEAAADDKVLPPAQRNAGSAATAPSHPSSGTAHPNPTIPSAPFRKLTPPPEAHPRRRAAPLVGGALAVVSLAGVALVAVTRHRAGAPAAPPLVDLEVVSDPPAATVILDGNAQAADTPTTFHLPRAREIVLRVEKHGYKPYDTVVRVEDGVAQKAVLAHLVALPAALHAQARVRDGVWTLDGRTVGNGPSLALGDVSAGTHMLRVEARGFEPHQEALRFVGGEDTAVDWELTPAAKKKKVGHAHAVVPDAPNLDFKAP